MAIKKSELYSHLWASCDALRGGMDASQYKDYVLSLLFIKYVSDKYGRSHVAQIITFGTLKAKAVVRDVARVMGVPYAKADRVAKPCRVLLRSSPRKRPRANWGSTTSNRSRMRRSLRDFGTR